MAFTTAQLTAIETAIARGELTVTYEGRSVTYRSMDDLLKARDTIKADLASVGGTTRSVSSTLASFSKD